MIGKKISNPFNTNNQYKNHKITKIQVKIIIDTLNTQKTHTIHKTHNMMIMKPRICTSIGLNVLQFKKITRNLRLKCFLRKISQFKIMWKMI